MAWIIACVLLGLVYLLGQRYFSREWDKGLQVRIYCEEERMREGQQQVLIEEIENNKRLHLPALKVKFATSKFWEFAGEQGGNTTDQYYRNDVFSVGGRERVRRKLSFVCRKRGYYVLGNLEIFVSDLFYTREYIKKIQQEQWVFVFAKRVHTQQLEDCFRQLLGEWNSNKRVYEDPFLFAGIRDYQRTDSMRRINWKASAKTGALKSNCYAYTAEQNLRLLVLFEQKNVDWDKNMEEYVLSLAVTLAERFMQEQIAIGMHSNGVDITYKEPLVIGAGCGSSHMQRMDEGIARIDLIEGAKFMQSPEEFLEEHLQENGCNIIITTYQGETLQMKMAEKMEAGYSIHWILPHYAFEKPKIVDALQPVVKELLTTLE